jgi:hypothetical protein
VPVIFIVIFIFIKIGSAIENLIGGIIYIQTDRQTNTHTHTHTQGKVIS